MAKKSEVKVVLDPMRGTSLSRCGCGRLFLSYGKGSVCSRCSLGR